ncbi:MAG: hypothetical protein HC941_08445 [Microcoleus sp. SU_5_3]|nr:hypothetical protein [Microcoleus sp. SU_5_3]
MKNKLCDCFVPLFGQVLTQAYYNLTDWWIKRLKSGIAIARPSFFHKSAIALPQC